MAHPHALIRPLSLLVIALAAAGCSRSEPEPASPLPVQTPTASPAEPVVPARSVPPVPSSSQAAPDAFSAAPANGDVIRANCKMGGCWWYRYESVQAEDTAPPRYRLRLRIGDSGPHPDPFPLQPDGVEIRWDAAAQPVTEVVCSREAPLVRVADREHRLALDPAGVSGVEQGIANLYFATCHGEWGDDGALAQKYGYAKR